ncbi:MAG: CoA transferase [Gammaproteobacteria bacterium]
MTQPPLAGLRVLDLAPETAPLCGQILAFLGAEVVTLPLPAGPVEYTVEGLARAAYGIGKHALDADAGARRSEIERLAGCCDVVVDAGCITQEAVGTSAIHVCVTPFGATGPRSDWRGGELLAQAAGGLLYMSGSTRDFPPAMLGAPIASCAAGMQAAVAVLLALRGRGAAGGPVRIDLSAQEAVANLLFKAQSVGHVGTVPDGRGTPPSGNAVIRRALWRCKDGWMTWNLWTGTGMGRKNLPVIDWMAEHGIEDAEVLRAVPWEELSLASVDAGDFNRWQEMFAAFFLQRTKAELAHEAFARRILLYPLNDMSEVAADPQLAAREVFVPVSIADGTAARAMGRPFRSTAYALRMPEGPCLPPAGDVHTRWSAARARMPAERAAGAPLAGMRVLDFGWALAGPVTTKYLAMFGADVIKIEHRKRPDVTRMSGPYPRGRPSMDGSASFANHNATKRSIGVDLAQPAAKDLLLRLAARADLVLENFAVGVLERHGLSFDALRAARADTILLRLSFQGQSGPRRTQAGYGNHVQAMCGLDSLCGFPGGPPGGPNQVLPDFFGPWFALVAALAALDHRDRTGQGQCIDIAQYETALTFLQPALLACTAAGAPPQRQGNRSAHACPHGVFPAAGTDAWIAIAAYDDAQWRALHGLLPEALRARIGPDAGLAQRQAAAGDIEQAIANWSRTQDAEALAQRLQAAGVAAYPVLDGKQLLKDAQLVARGHYAWPEHEYIGRVPIDCPAFRSDALVPHVTPGPRYAAHTLEALADWLAIDDDEIATLLGDGVITCD